MTHHINYALVSTLHLKRGSTGDAMVPSVLSLSCQELITGHIKGVYALVFEGSFIGGQPVHQSALGGSGCSPAGCWSSWHLVTPPKGFPYPGTEVAQHLPAAHFSFNTFTSHSVAEELSLFFHDVHREEHVFFSDASALLIWNCAFCFRLRTVRNPERGAIKGVILRKELSQFISYVDIANRSNVLWV